MRARRGLLILVAVAATLRLAAQTCTPAMTPADCFQQFVPSPRPADPAASADKTLAEVNTGTANVLSPAGSALRDFLALFAASVESATLKDTSNALTLDWNLPVPILGTGRPLKLQAVITKPELNSELVKALDTNSDAIATLRGGLPETGDIAVSASINAITTHFGREMGPHRNVLEAALDDADRQKEDIIVDMLPRLREAMQAAHVTGNQTFESQENAAVAACDNHADKDQCVADAHANSRGAIAAIEAVAMAIKARREALIKGAINPFTRLLNNQPQFYFSGIVHARDKLVGPNETSGKVTYEMPFAPNLNDVYTSNAGCTPAAITASNKARCATALTATAATLAADPATDEQNRLAISAEYKEVAKTDINLTQYSTTLQKAGSHSFTGSLTYGYALDLTGGLTKQDRVDISLTYENVSGDPLKNDRGVGSITFTKKISPTMSLPVALLYANHAQYLSTVDRKLNVHFGLVFKLPK